jgi:hypothetical protein
LFDIHDSNSPGHEDCTMHRFISAMLLSVLLAGSVQAELIALSYHSRADFAGGKPFGDVGPYEKISGVARFAVDPQHPRNRHIVDLQQAPRNASGKVEFASDFTILAPKDPAKGNGAIFYDVNNRGNKLALRFFNSSGGGNNLDKPGSEGNGFLMRRGYTVVWCGWIGELLPGDDRLLLQAPIATNPKPIQGTVRYEMISDEPAETQPLSRREGHGSYPPTAHGEKTGVLTWRLRETDPRVLIPREQWSLIRMPVTKVGDGVPGTLPQIRLKVAGGFRPGYIYELVCEAEGPIVQGLGFAAVRDLVSFLQHDATTNPIRRADGRPALDRAYAFGVSQSGRFLRHLLYEGFNVDEQGRLVFAGLMPHVAGAGLGFFNHRFAQPTRHNGEHEEHLYPADVFPFTYGPQTDPFTKRTDSILAASLREKVGPPKVMHTQSAAEYWHRSGSLVHTDPLGKVDAVIPGNVRIYAFGGTQHGPATKPALEFCDNLTNPADYSPLLRGLLDALDAWVTAGITPPPSMAPRIDQKTLVPWRQEESGFPALPGVRYPQVIQQPPFADYGPQFFKDRIITFEPPVVHGKYTVLVPRCDADGNELGTMLPAEVAVPIATYCGWNLRRRDVGAEGALASLKGSFIPFPRTRAEREASGDSRLSLEERYGGFEAYRKLFSENCNTMVRSRFMPQEDADRLVSELERVRERFVK